MNLAKLRDSLDELSRWPDAEVVVILFDPTTGEPVRYTARAAFSSGPGGSYVEIRPAALHHQQFKPWPGRGSQVTPLVAAEKSP